MNELIYPDLRAYQIDVRDRVRTTATKVPHPIRVILQASTGAGKSVCAVDLILRCFEKGKRALFIVSGRTLVDQFERHLIKAGAPVGVIMSGRGITNSLIQIASKDTLAARSIRTQRQFLPDADLVIIDECHNSVAKEWVKILEHYRNAVVIGLTATPALGNGKGLGHVYNGMERAVSTKQLVSEGFLVPCRVFAPDAPDLRGVKVEASGDYNRDQLAARMDKPKLTGNVVANWKRHADGRRTVVFGCNIQHAKHLCDEFNQAGITFRHIDQETPDDEREEIFGLITDGKIMGFTNVSVARQGLDLPCLEASCVVRPTRSLVLWLQMVGRIRRPSPGKTDCVVVDHAGACDAHCMPDEEIEWSLDSKKKIGDWLDNAKEEGKIPKQTICPECSCMFTGQRCPNCGFTHQEKPRHTKQPEYADGILVERTEQKKSAEFEEMQRHWNKCLAVAVNKGLKLGAAVHMFSQKYGQPPWKVNGLRNMPDESSAWSRMAEDLYPGFKRVKVTA